MKRLIIFFIFVLLAVSGCGNLLAEDVTPPPGAEIIQQTQEADVVSDSFLYPLVPPSVQAGSLIYKEKCEPCHGQRGLGDGPSAVDLPNPVTAIGSKQVARQASPAEWYRIVTEGNLDRFMPPFDSLSDRERWDVVAYSFSLSTQENDLAQAETIFMGYCAGCHGEQVSGESPPAAGPQSSIISFQDLEGMATKSSQDIYQAVTEGVNSEMPAFKDQISDTERWLLSDYVRNLLFDRSGERINGEQAGDVDLMDAASSDSSESDGVQGLGESPSLEVGSVNGEVINGSSGEVPPGISVTLYGFDQVQQVYTATTQIDADGHFSFTEVEMPPDRVFMATTEFNGVTYGSNIGTAHADGMNLELPITVYESSTDTSDLVADRLHLFYELLDEGTLRVVELYIISNRGARTIVAEEEGLPVIEFMLPDAAQNLEIQDGQIGDGRYVGTANGFGDTIGVRPGSGNYQIMFTYLMPFERNTSLQHSLPLPAEAVVVLAPENLRIKTDDLEDMGLRDVQGVQYQMFSTTSMAAGGEMAVILSGSMGGSFFNAIPGSTTSLILGLSALVVALIGAGIWLHRRNQALNGKVVPAAQIDDSMLVEEDADTVMDAIVALDDLYREGELPEDAYQQRRLELKARLKELMRQESGADD